jgi:hypothetical protein
VGMKAKWELLVIIALSFLVRVWPAYAADFVPGGDAYMAVAFAREIDLSGKLTFAQYSEISALWGEFWHTYYTPNLHVLLQTTHALTGLSYDACIIFLTLLLSLTTLLLVYAICAMHSYRLAVLATFFVGVGIPPLQRYTSLQVGFHFQNLLGDAVLLMLVFALIHLFQRIEQGQAKLQSVVAVLLIYPALVLTHQLSSYVGTCIVVTSVLGLLLFSKDIRRWKHWAWVFGVWGLAVVGGVLVVWKFGYLESVLTILGSNHPVILASLVPITEFPNLVGNSPTYLAVIGSALLTGYLLASKNAADARSCRSMAVVVLMWFFTVLILTQGRRWGIGLNGIRLLWFICYPMAILCAFALLRVFAMGLHRHWVLLGTGLAMSAVLLLTLGAIRGAISAPEWQQAIHSEDIKEVAAWLRTTASEGDVIWYDYLQYRGTVWLHSDIVPYKRVALRPMKQEDYEDLEHIVNSGFDRSYIVLNKHFLAEYSINFSAHCDVCFENKGLAVFCQCELDGTDG